MVGKLTALIDGTDQLATTKRAELRGRISTMPGLNRFLRVTPKGLLRIDKAKITAEANLGGKYLLRCSDPHLVGAENPVTSCDLHVFVDEAAEPVSS